MNSIAYKYKRMSVSDNIKAIRHKEGLAQAEIARRLEVEPSSYHRLENRGDKMTLEQVDSVAKALGVSRIELLTWNEEPALNNEDNAQALPRIQELEDRLRDKNKLIERLDTLEKELDSANSAVADYIWELIDQEAIDTHVGEVELHYSTPARVLNVSMELYSKSFKDNTLIDDSYHTYDIILTDAQIADTFYKLLEDKQVISFVAYFHRRHMLKDDMLSRLFETYTGIRYRLSTRKKK